MSSPRVVVIGAGFGGLGVAQALRRAGVGDITILERADDVGGVWRDNTYPGAACDVPTPLYSWSWAPNPEWGRRYGPSRRSSTTCGVRPARPGCSTSCAPASRSRPRSTTRRAAAGA